LPVLAPDLFNGIGNFNRATARSAFASSYVMALSAANLAGRVGWASLSDKVGRKAMFTLFTAGSVPLYFAIPACVNAVVAEPSVQPLAVFYGILCSAGGGVE